MLDGVISFAGLALEQSRAFTAARDKYRAGESLETCLRAFADATENEVDDRAIEAVLVAAEQLATWSTFLGIQGLVLSTRLAGWVDRIVAVEPDLRDALNDLARMAGQLARACQEIKLRDAEPNPRR